MTPVLASLDEVADRYDALFCDLWGCLHDGLRAFPAAVSALRRFRDRGGAVILLTNAPRPAREVRAQLDAMGVPRAAWDAIVTSGEAAQAALAAGEIGTAVWHCGPERDHPFFTDLPPDLPPGPAIRLVPSLREAEGIACTGLFDDERETPADYRAMILEGVTRRLPLLCANPDIVVDRGDRRIYCAGAIAEAYAEAGGRALYYGKPHAPIYGLARRRLAALGRDAEEARILCAGDGLATDIAGGIGEGFDTLLVTGGLLAAETGTAPGRGPDPGRLAAVLARARLSPTAAIPYLA